MAKAYSSAPLVSAHALVCSGEQVLLVQRLHPPFVGHWTVPGGGVELGETLEQAVVREVREETGLDVAVSRYLGYVDAITHDSSDRIEYHYVIHYFAADVVGGKLQPGQGEGAASWFSVEEAQRLPLTDSVERCLCWAGMVLEKEEHSQ